MGKGTYLGGCTIISARSGWFSHKKSAKRKKRKTRPLTDAELAQNVSAEAASQGKPQKVKKISDDEKAKKKLKAEELKRVTAEKKAAALAARNTPEALERRRVKAAQIRAHQERKMAKVVVIIKRRRKITAPMPMVANE